MKSLVKMGEEADDRFHSMGLEETMRINVEELKRLSGEWILAGLVERSR